jgi:Fe-S oxidoreductase
MMLKDYEETINHCLKCGACKTAFGPFMPICPSGLKYGFESHYAVGRLEIAKAILDGRLQIDANVMKRIYTCTSCAGCDQQCGPNVGVYPLQIIEAIKREAMETGLIPPEVRDFLKSMNIHGNPYVAPAEERGEWARDMDIDLYDGQEYLFYVGCVGSYDERGQRIARSVARLMQKAGISFGILGVEERCDGNEVNRVGEWDLFAFMAKENIEFLQHKGVKKIFSLTPHGFNAFKNDYPRWGSDFEVLHYTQLLRQLYAQGKIKPAKELRARITYHDPCFLGRHNGEYDAPRELLEATPGVELREMEMNRKNAFCCGGGGGNFFTDILGSGPKSPSRIRVRQALETGAQIIAVACPNCARMLEDAVKIEELQDKIVVKDISEILAESY